MAQARGVARRLAAGLTKGVARVWGASSNLVQSSVQGLKDVYQEALDEHKAERASIQTIGALQPGDSNADLVIVSGDGGDITGAAVRGAPKGKSRSTAARAVESAAEAAAASGLVGTATKATRQRSTAVSVSDSEPANRAAGASKTNRTPKGPVGSASGTKASSAAGRSSASGKASGKPSPSGAAGAQAKKASGASQSRSPKANTGAVKGKKKTGSDGSVPAHDTAEAPVSASQETPAIVEAGGSQEAAAE